MIRRLLLFLVRFLHDPRVIPNRDASDPYLSRWYLFRKEAPQEDSELPGTITADEIKKPRKHPDLFLHRFHRGDDDSALHSHPFKWSLAFILVGGYWEERRVGDQVIRRLIKPFRFNFIRSTDYHRVELLEEDAWTLFLVGPRTDEWYFWDREKKARMQWQEFIRRRQKGAEPAWEEDRREAS